MVMLGDLWLSADTVLLQVLRLPFTVQQHACQVITLNSPSLSMAVCLCFSRRATAMNWCIVQGVIQPLHIFPVCREGFHCCGSVWGFFCCTHTHPGDVSAQLTSRSWLSWSCSLSGRWPLSLPNFWIMKKGIKKPKQILCLDMMMCSSLT